MAYWEESESSETHQQTNLVPSKKQLGVLGW